MDSTIGSSNILRWAVVGFGHIGRRHADMVINDSLTKLVAICDIKPKEELIFSSNTSDIPFFSCVEDFLLSDIEFDVVSICVPNGLHFAVACKFLDINKTTVIEKPIVLNDEHIDILRQKSNNGKLIYGVLQNRYTPCCRWLKGIIDSKCLGCIYRVDMNCLWNRDNRYYTSDSWHGDKLLDGGTLFTQYSHFIDLLLWFFGDIDILSAKFYNYNHQSLIDFEDSGNIDFITQSGIDGSIIYSTSIYEKNMSVSMNIIAENGTIRLSGPFMNILEYCNIKGIDRPDDIIFDRGNNYGGYSGSACNHHLVINNIAKDILGMPSEVTRLDDGERVVKLINEIYKFKK